MLNNHSLDKCSYAASLEVRKQTYLKVLAGCADVGPKICIIGDRPGPSAPQDIGYHHTPFYSTKHCSGWLNSLLHLNGIPENRLVWVNSTLYDGCALDSNLLQDWDIERFIALGGAAEKWAKKSNLSPLIKVDHPQYWKRFRSSSRYPLVDILRSAL
jgi:hypothetical protein